MSFQFEANFFRRLLDEAGVRPARLLVVGCGPAQEMGALAGAVGAMAVGVDLDVSPASRAPGVHVVRGDARCLPFRDGTFDALYCYHVLEHIPGPEAALVDGRRVLAAGSMAYYGTPNKSRLVGYLGGRGTRYQKFIWNVKDYRRRLAGRWSNEQGAHAGFTAGELKALLARAFPDVESVGLPYYLGKYPRLAWLWKTAFGLGFAGFLAPSVYFRALCARREGARASQSAA